MNLKYFLDEGLKFLEIALGARYGTDGFFTLLAIAVVSLLVVPWVLGKWIGSSDRGPISCFLGIILPIVAAFLGFEIWKLYGVQWFGDAAWVGQSTSLVAIISGVVVLWIVSPFFFGIGFFRTMVVFFVSALIVMGLLEIGQRLTIKDRAREESRVWYDPRTWKVK